MAYPVTNARTSFPSMDIPRELTLAEKQLLNTNLGVVPGAFADDDTVMTGADPRAGVKGGVNLAGNRGDVPGYGYPFSGPSGDFTLLFRLRPRWTDQRSSFLAAFADDSLISYGSVGASDFFVYVTVGDKRYFRTAGYAPADALGKWATVAVVRTAGVFSVYFDGVLAPPETTAYSTTSPINRLLGGIAGGYGQFQGDVQDIQCINRALTADEIKLCNKGEIPAELARQAVSATGSGFWTGSGTISGTSTTGFTLNGPAGSYSEAVFSIPGGVKPGERLLVSFTSTNTPVQSGCGLRGTPSETVWSLGTPTVDGANSVVVTATSEDPSIRLIFGSGVNAASGWAISSAAITRLGTVEHFAASEVTSFGRWIGKFGTSLIPGAGITPLDPQPVQVRMEQFRYDLATSTLTDGPTDWTITKAGAGVLTVTPPAYAKAIKPPVITASHDTAFMTQDVITDQTTGVTTITNRLVSGGTSSDTVVYGHVTFRE